MVKMGRKLYKDRNRITDEFDNNKALKEWIGISDTHTE